MSILLSYSDQMSFGKHTTLSNGASIPLLGLGTWLSKPKEVENAVEYAVRAGYRHLDLAMIYENQHEVGAALKKVIPSVVKREELFITSKLWNTGHQPAEVEKELDQTLKLLGLDYVDLYLIHWPVAFPPGNGLFPPHATITGEVEIDKETSLVDTWKAMLALPKSKVRAVGVSNFTIAQLEGIISATRVVPVVNQVEAHPLLLQNDLVEYAKSKNIHLTAYSPLGNNLVGAAKLTEHAAVVAIANRLKATPAQVLIAFAIARGYSVIPKSVQPERIDSNFKQIELGAEDVAALEQIGKDKHHRFNIPFEYKPKWDVNISDEPVEKQASFKAKII